jgi:hypothetical protein
MSQILSSDRLELELLTAEMMREALECLACQRKLSSFIVPAWWPNARPFAGAFSGPSHCAARG